MKYQIDFDKDIHGSNSGWTGQVTLRVNGVVVQSWYCHGTNYDDNFKLLQTLDFYDRCSENQSLPQEMMDKLYAKITMLIDKCEWEKYPIVKLPGEPLPLTAIREYIIHDYGVMYFNHKKFIKEHYEERLP